MRLSFRQRVATYFMLASSILLILVFGIVYFTVKQSVYSNIDSDLSYEANKHLNELFFNQNDIRFKNKDEWNEKEHIEVEVNPVFLQLNNKDGEVKDKSPNLKENVLPFDSSNKSEYHTSTILNNKAIRQVQIPIIRSGKTKGYILSAMSLESSLMVLKNLRNILYLLFPIVVLGIFFASSFLAGRSIKPVLNIIKTTNRISKNNLNERVELPQHDDELYDLSSSINSLLDRIEHAIDREKQFTSDASHELRTPLSVLRGTLEVLVRKPRTVEEYQEKIMYSLGEIDRMTSIIEQLLDIARLDIHPEKNAKNETKLVQLMHQILERKESSLKKKNIELQLDVSQCDKNSTVNGFYASLIISNLISNAIKYSNDGGLILVSLSSNQVQKIVRIEDFGIGIKKEDLNNIFIPFFRSNALEHKSIKGEGLGLSIVQKAAKAIKAEITIESEINKGTIVTIIF
jgi:signal transduction histidine kinase